MFISFRRTIKYAFIDFWRNFWLSFITVTMVVFALVSVNFLLLFNVLSDKAIESVENKVDVSVFFKPEVNDNQIYEIQTKLLSLIQVKDVSVVSKEEAMESFKEIHKNDKSILASLDELGENPLGSTLVVRAKSAKDFPLIIEVLDHPKFAGLIQEKNFSEHEEMIRKISSISYQVKKTAAYVSIVFILIAIIIVFNTIRVALYTHKEEIKIMKLVGASNWFVKMPFFIQSVFFSLIACSVTVAIIYPLIGYFQPHFVEFLRGVDFDLMYYFNSNLLLVFGIEFLVASLLNIFSSSYAIRKYLRV